MSSEDGEPTVKVKSTISDAHAEFLDSICRAGKAISRSDAVRYVINRSMEKQIIDLDNER